MKKGSPWMNSSHTLVLPASVSCEPRTQEWLVQGPLGQSRLALGELPTLYRWDPHSRELVLRGAGASSLARRLRQAFHGVQYGYMRALELQGVGFRAQVEGSAGNQTLRLRLGQACDYRWYVPPHLAVICTSPTQIRLLGVDAAEVGHWAARLVALRPPNAYTGKGVRYQGQDLPRKLGKRTRL